LIWTVNEALSLRKKGGLIVLARRKKEVRRREKEAGHLRGEESLCKELQRILGSILRNEAKKDLRIRGKKKREEKEMQGRLCLRTREAEKKRKEAAPFTQGGQTKTARLISDRTAGGYTSSALVPGKVHWAYGRKRSQNMHDERISAIP